MAKYPLYLISLAMIALGAWWLLHPDSAADRNVVGDPGMEQLVSQCEAGTPSWTVRFYEGSAALSGSWQSITATTPGADERQWFYSLLKPRVKSVQCKGDSIEIYGPTGLLDTIAAQDLPQYIKLPTVYSRGLLEHHEWDGRRSDSSTSYLLKIAGGVLLVLLGALVAWITSRVTGGRERLS